MLHPEKTVAKSNDMPGRCRGFTDPVYSGPGDSAALWAQMNAAQHAFDPPPPVYHAYIGEMHGHTSLSDGSVDIDTYFTSLRDRAGVDFAALTDHDHGGVGKAELWSGSPSKWELIRQKVREYYRPGSFTTLLAYERDSYPYYNNLIVYYGSDCGEMLRGVHDGEITGQELAAALARQDIFLVPHDTYSLSSGADLGWLPPELFTPFIEVYSRADAAEYMGNPAFDRPDCREGGFWQDALARGARMGCIGGSDDHGGQNGLITQEPYPRCFPGLTGVWAAENTRDAIFAALKARRCYAFMGGRMTLDLRIDGHYMGEEFTAAKDGVIQIWFDVTADAPIRQITLVKNNRDYMRFFKAARQLIFDYRRERQTDWFYLRVELADGRFGWTSPIWVDQAPTDEAGTGEGQH